MEQTDQISESSTSSSSRKKQKVPEIEEEDRISSLPEPILAHILSLMPTKDAVKTVLLRTFGNLWTSIYNLNFNVCLDDCLSNTHSKDQLFFKFVDHVLLLHESPTIVKFHLKFEHAFYGGQHMSRPLADRVNAWIHFAMKKRVKVLQLEILEQKSYGALLNYDLPDFVLLSKSLTELKLVNCGLKPRGQIQMEALKILSLSTIILNDTIIEEILSGCPLLENLSLIWCYGLLKLNLTSACLKNFMITLGEGEISRLEL